MKTCCRTAPPKTSAWMVNFTLILLECGSVHTKPASINLTRLRPFSFDRHNPRSSRDSKEHLIHCSGGCRYLQEQQIRKQLSHKQSICSSYLSHPLQKYRVACLGMPSDMSTCVRRQATHIFAGLGSIGVPHWQQRLERQNTMAVRTLSSKKRKPICNKHFRGAGFRGSVHVLHFFCCKGSIFNEIKLSLPHVSSTNSTCAHHSRRPGAAQSIVNVHIDTK